MLRLLIADDHEIVRRGLRQLLAEAFPSARIEETSDGTTTLDAVRRSPWNLILLDLNMPGQDGIAVLRELKRLRPATPVLILTAADEGALAVRALQAGAAGYVNKRDAADELVIAARKALDGQTHLSTTTVNRLSAGLRGESADAPHAQLSRRELEVFRLIALGRSTKEIAAQLDLSEKTVATYLERIREKTGLHTPVEIARYALQQGLVD